MSAGRLSDAIRDGDGATARRILAAEPALVDARDAHAMTPLMCAVAALEHDLELVDDILAAGADPRAATPQGWTALHFASDAMGTSSEDEWPARFLGRLVAAGADLEARQEWGWTPLMRAALEGSVPEVEALLALGADPDVDFPAHSMPEFVRGWTLLEVIYAVPDSLALLDALLRGGADPTRRNAAGLTALEAGLRMLVAPDEDARADYLASVRACVERLRERAG